MRRIWIGTGVVAVVAVAGVLVIATRSSAPPLETTSIRTSFEHSVVGFGDRVHARAVVVLDASVSSKARLTVNVAPLVQLGSARVTRVKSDGGVALTVDVDAVCIYDACIGKGGRKVIQLPDARVTVPGGSVLESAPWPPLEIRGRVVAADLIPVQLPLKRDALPPQMDYRIAPATLATLLAILAAVLALAGVALVGVQVARIRRERIAWAEPLTEIERALQLAREAESRPPADRRRALALLERLLRPRDPRLAREARDLAWSSPPPGPEQLDELVTQVERKVKR